MGEIYKLTFPNGKGYVGQVKTTAVVRFSRHKCSARKGSKLLVHNAWRRYGTPTLTVLMTVEDSELGAAEVAMIKFHFQMSREEAAALASELRNVIEGTLHSMPNSTVLLALLTEVLSQHANT